MGGVPDRWLDYSPYGDVIQGTRFLPFKVPLKHNLCMALEEQSRFNIPGFLESLQSKGLKLGLVIDLTNTTRYYFKKDFQDKGVLYAKIFTEGHVVPSDSVYGKFFGVIEKFLDAQKDLDTIIGVHCTHGVNRTGQLLCRYMIEKLVIEPSLALDAFKKARGHPIERKLYIQDLLQRQPGAPDPALDWRSLDFEAWDVCHPGDRGPHQPKPQHAESRPHRVQAPSSQNTGHDRRNAPSESENWRESARNFRRELPVHPNEEAGARSWRPDGRAARNGYEPYAHDTSRHRSQRNEGQGGRSAIGQQAPQDPGSEPWRGAGRNSRHDQHSAPRQDWIYESQSSQGRGYSSGWGGGWQRRPHSSPQLGTEYGNARGENSYSHGRSHYSPLPAGQSAVQSALLPQQQAWGTHHLQGGNASSYHHSASQRPHAGQNSYSRDSYSSKDNWDQFRVDRRSSNQPKRSHSDQTSGFSNQFQADH